MIIVTAVDQDYTASCQWTWSTAGFCMYVIFDLVNSTDRPLIFTTPVVIEELFEKRWAFGCLRMEVLITVDAC